LPTTDRRRIRSGLLAGGLAGLLAGCQTPDTVPLTLKEQQEVGWLNKKSDPNAGKIAERGTLFTSLDQNLRTWRQLTTSTEVGDISQRDSIEQALTRQVYINFDAILDELEHGTDPEHKVVAAAALGFSRIPGPDEPGGNANFPVLHPRAVGPLLAVLESGNDQIVMNALLSLGRIAAPDMPRDMLVELMVTHHSEDVRANAALALASIVTDADASLVVAPLYSALSDPSHKVRLHAIKALVRVHDPNTQPALLNILRKDPMPLVQACAAMELGRIGNYDAIDALIEGLHVNHYLLFVECQRSLMKLTGESKKDYTEWRTWWDKNPNNPQKVRGS
jgi:HEAT repeat protein